MVYQLELLINALAERRNLRERDIKSVSFDGGTRKECQERELHHGQDKAKANVF